MSSRRNMNMSDRFAVQTWRNVALRRSIKSARAERTSIVWIPDARNDFEISYKCRRDHFCTASDLAVESDIPKRVAAFFATASTRVSASSRTFACSGRCCGRARVRDFVSRCSPSADAFAEPAGARGRDHVGEGSGDLSRLRPCPWCSSVSGRTCPPPSAHAASSRRAVEAGSEHLATGLVHRLWRRSLAAGARCTLDLLRKREREGRSPPSCRFSDVPSQSRRPLACASIV